MLDEIMDSGADEPSNDEQAEEVGNDQPEATAEQSGEAEQANEEPDAEEDNADASEATEEQPEGDAEGSEVVDTVTVEFDGEEYKVPAKIKDALMREQDYTAKTQTHAEDRKAFEAEQADFRQYAEASRAHSDQMAQLAAIDSQLKQFEEYDWNTAFDTDIVAATKLRHQADQLQQTRQSVVGEIQEAETERTRLHNENLARTAERTDAQLRTEIPNWGDDVKAELGKFAVETMGFPAEAVANAVTPQEIKALYYAQVGFKTLNAVKAEEVKAKAPEKVAKPSKNIKPKRQKAPTDLSKISDPEAYRNAYMARKRKAVANG